MRPTDRPRPRWPGRRTSPRPRRRSSTTSSAPAPPSVRRNKALKLASRPGESEGDFAAALPGRGRRRGRRRPGQAAAEVRGPHRQGPGRPRHRVRPGRPGPRPRRTPGAAATSPPAPAPLLGAVLGGKRRARSMARDVGRVLTGRSRSDEAAQRVETAQNRVERAPAGAGRPRGRPGRRADRHRRRVERQGRRDRDRRRPAREVGHPGDGAVPRVGPGRLTRGNSGGTARRPAAHSRADAAHPRRGSRRSSCSSTWSSCSPSRRSPGRSATTPTAVGLGRGVLVFAVLWWAWGAYAWLTNAVDTARDGAPRRPAGEHGRHAGHRARGPHAPGATAASPSPSATSS